MNRPPSRSAGVPLALAAAAGTLALYQGLVVRSYALTTPKWGRGASLRLAVVCDLHSRSFGPSQAHLLEELARLRPHLILMPGDMVDDRVPPEPAWIFLRGAAKIAPCYYAPGNHEYRTKRMDQVIERIRACGVTPLLDRALLLETPAGPLLLAGCEDPERSRFDPGYRQAPSLFSAFGEAASSPAYTVLMAHRPERAPLYRRLGFDLAVSGHAHGGQVRLPLLLNGLYAPDQGLLPPYSGGCYRRGRLCHVVSRGVAVLPGLPRVFNPPEITAIHVTGVGAPPQTPPGLCP